MRQYRLLADYPLNGQRNMAVDEAVLNAVVAGNAPPTLRFYAWLPACLSLGYGQHVQDVDEDRLRAMDWHLVRRPTGGKAILHVDELTYSLILPEGHPLTKVGIVESYRRISQALLYGLNLLGLRSQADKKADNVKQEGPVCFETPSHYEITTQDGRKLIGSAQLRRRGALLQHGSLPLYGDITRICDVLAYSDEAARQAAKSAVRARAVTLEEALGQRMTWEVVMDALVQGFQQILDADLIPDDLSRAEWLEANRLEHEVYGNYHFTHKT
ncbi:MAG: octanoyltransferase [Phototrophicales bacterium]|nr:MAG: octanoyltransferase [Phototrophicales bacterium]RMG77168.1 MAG: lipoate--protein ligase family protein [Chloroflexota bacterium]